MKGKLLTGVMYLVYWVDLTGIRHICGLLNYLRLCEWADCISLVLTYNVNRPDELHHISLFGLLQSASETKESHEQD